MNKTILITGSTDGIGKLAAIQLAKDGHTVLLHGRNAAKLDDVILEVKRLTSNENVKGFVADFSNLAAVRAMAKKISEEVSAIDVLINNAGIFNSPSSQNKAGLDIRMVVNYLAPYLLTKNLLPVIEKGTAPRILNLSSAAQNPVSYDVLSGKEKQSERISYGQSKLALTMWSFHLAKQLKDIVVIAVNPGSLLNTKMVQEAFGQFWASADKGATILYDLAISDEYSLDTGKYFDNDQGAFGNAHADAYDETKIGKLISVTETMI